MTESYSFHWGSFGTVFDISFQKDYSLWEFSASKNFFNHLLSVCGLGTREDDGATFPRLLSTWRKMQAVLSVHQDACFTEATSRLCFVILTYGRMPIITWRSRTVSIEVVSARSLISLSRKTTVSESFPLRRTFSIIFCLSAVLGQEKTTVPLFHVYFHRDGSCKLSSLCIKTHVSPKPHPDCVLWFWHTVGCQ